MRASEMWHSGILRLKLRHSEGTSGKVHTPSVHAAPDPACSDEAEHNTDVKRRFPTDFNTNKLEYMQRLKDTLTCDSFLFYHLKEISFKIFPFSVNW